MKTIGIIGGIGPESTVDYYRSLVALYRQKKSDNSYPLIILNSINLTRVIDLVTDGELEKLVDFLVPEVNKLAVAGADFGFFASNTPHLVFDEIAGRSPIPLISIVEATCAAAKALGLKKLGLFGSGFTMKATFYRDTFARAGMALVSPGFNDQRYIHEKYMTELLFGTIKPETHAYLLSIVDDLMEREHIDGLILGGTELPLILREATYRGIPFLNTTEIHVKAAIEELLR
jgi:aspartate racemase